jgi:hypothetical protein
MLAAISSMLSPRKDKIIVMISKGRKFEIKAIARMVVIQTF